RLRIDALGQQETDDLGPAPLRSPTQQCACWRGDTRQIHAGLVSAPHLVDVATYHRHDEVELCCTEHPTSMPRRTSISASSPRPAISGSRFAIARRTRRPVCPAASSATTLARHIDSDRSLQEANS